MLRRWLVPPVLLAAMAARSVGAQVTTTGPRNSIVFRDTDVRALEDEQLGGFGLDDLDQRDTAGYKGTAVVQAGRHAIHGGVEFMRNTNFRDTTYDGGLYVSLSPALSGLTAGGRAIASVQRPSIGIVPIEHLQLNSRLQSG